MSGMIRRWSPVIAVLVVFTTVLFASLFGILTRPLGFLATFWPANALLLGLFVRRPRLATPLGWLAALAGYLAADLMTGGNLLLTAWLTAANLAGVATGFALFRRLPEDDRRLRRPSSVLYLLGILMIAAAAAAAVGFGAAPVFFGSDPVSGVAFWFTAELVNGIIILPVILTAPPLATLSARYRRPGDLSVLARDAAPIVAVIVLTLVGLLARGPGAIVFPSPALLWVALTLGIFTTAVVTMLVSMWHLIGFTLGYYAPYVAKIDTLTMSDRLGITLLALGPLTVASMNAARGELIRRLEGLATIDALTGALSRGAFLEQASDLVGDRQPTGRPVSVLMLDLDHFKRINDTYGHAAGDRALHAFAAAVRASLRETDILGRLGGEEFAAVLPDADERQASVLAERLRRNIEAIRLPLEGGPLQFTVSIGVATHPPAASLPLARLLVAADEALYRAKAGGRNRIAVNVPPLPPEAPG